MDSNVPKLNPRYLAFAAGGLFAISAAVLLVGKVFYAWPIDGVAVALFLTIWIPTVLPLLRRLKYKDIEIEFIERSVKQVQAEVATLANRTEIETEKRELKIQVDSFKIRLRHSSERVDERYFRVKVWLDAPPDFLTQIKKVVFERHPTFKRRFHEINSPPFEDTFRCWGEFTIRAVIELKTGESLRRQRYLSLEHDSSK
jgi:hypothetical protein